MAAFSFPKSEKLCRKSDIDLIFSKGKSIQEYPFRMLYLFAEQTEVPLKAAFSVPKKRFKRAVDRNLLKRRMREAFRLNNSALKEMLGNKSLSMHVFFIYLSDQKLPYGEIEDKIMLLLQRLEKRNEENSQ